MRACGPSHADPTSAPAPLPLLITCPVPPSVLPAPEQRNHAATDSKFTTAALMAKGQRSWAISSPTYVQQPVFVWSTSPYASVSHIGQPDRWEFPWLTVGFPPETDE